MPSVFGPHRSLRGSIPDQLRECDEAIDAQDGRCALATYTDESFSAFSRSRGPGLLDAMQHAEDLAEEHGSAELWAQHSDRLARGDGRSARHAVEIALWALKRDVAVRTVQDPDTFRDLLYAVVTGQRNHEDSRRKGLAMAAGRRRAAARGDFIGYEPPGYKLAIELRDGGRVKKRMVIDPERREVIETIFRLVLRGRPTGAVARALNDAGWRTNPSRKGIAPKKWTVERVDVVLRNPRYAGLAVFDGEVVARGHWPAYISERQHQRVRARMATHDRATTKPLRLETYLLAQLMRCGSCDEPLYCATGERRQDGTHARRYVCASHDKGRDADRCQAPRIAAEMLEAMFIASLRTLLLDSYSAECETDQSEPCAVLDLTREREQLRDAALAAELEFHAALERLLVRMDDRARASDPARLSQRQRRQLEAVTRFEAWAAEELSGRTEASRAEAPELNHLLSGWLSSITVTVGATNIEIVVTPRFPVGPAGDSPVRRAAVTLDPAEWTRVACLVGRPRLRSSAWDDAEILGALQAWAEINGRSPTWMDWRAADATRPNAITVRRHFRTWKRALHLAGLHPFVPASAPRNYAWSDADILAALKDWAAKNGRPPKWDEWMHATPERPCTNTVCQHFGGWRAGLAAAGL